MDKPHSTRSQLYYKKRKARNRARKAANQLSYVPEKHKQSFTRALRNKLKNRHIPSSKSAKMPGESLLFGSFNIQGLDLDAYNAVQDILQEKKFDVGKNSKTIFMNFESNQVLAISETKSRGDNPIDIPRIPNYECWR